MAVIIPYVPGGLALQTEQWGKSVGATFERLDPHKDDDYFHLLDRYWGLPGPLLIVEEDNVPTVPTSELLHCRHPWCVCPYGHGTVHLLDHALGVVCFSARLKREVPDLIALAGSGHVDREPPRVWWRMDERIARVLSRAGYSPHLHAEALHSRGHGVAGARNA